MLLVVDIASMAHNLFVNKDYLQKFANNLRKLRKERKLTQEDLMSEKVSRSMVSLVELARTDLTVSTLKAIADSLGVKVKDLFDFE